MCAAGEVSRDWSQKLLAEKFRFHNAQARSQTNQFADVIVVLFVIVFSCYFSCSLAWNPTNQLADMIIFLLFLLFSLVTLAVHWHGTIQASLPL